VPIDSGFGRDHPIDKFFFLSRKQVKATRAPAEDAAAEDVVTAAAATPPKAHHRPPSDGVNH